MLKSTPVSQKHMNSNIFENTNGLSKPVSTTHYPPKFVPTTTPTTTPTIFAMSVSLPYPQFTTSRQKV
jgi:hypothetical protein